MAVMRLDWKYALRVPLNWSGFHYSDLCNFRQRLLAHEREQTVFERVVGYLRERGYIQAGGKQRTDSTTILGAVRDLSTIDLVHETLRLAFVALVSVDAPWVLKHVPNSFVQNYAARRRFEWKGQGQVVEALQKAA